MPFNCSNMNVISSLKNNTGIVSAMLFFCTRYGSSDPIQKHVCRFLMPRISNIQRCKTPNKADRTLTSRWFSLGTLVSFSNKTDRHGITKILLKVALNTITISPNRMTLYM